MMRCPGRQKKMKNFAIEREGNNLFKSRQEKGIGGKTAFERGDRKNQLQANSKEGIGGGSEGKKEKSPKARTSIMIYKQKRVLRRDKKSKDAARSEKKTYEFHPNNRRELSP